MFHLLVVIESNIINWSKVERTVDDFYYVKVSSSNPKKIKLFTALSFLTDDTNAVEFESNDYIETHTFVLYDQRSQIIDPQKVFKKFNLNQNITNGTGEDNSRNNGNVD